MIMGLEPLSDKGTVRVAGPSKPRDGSGDPIPVSKDLMGGEAWSSSAALRQHKNQREQAETQEIPFKTWEALPYCEVLKHRNGFPWGVSILGGLQGPNGCGPGLF